MQRSKLLTILLLTSSATVFANLNQDFAKILATKSPLNVNALYDQWLQEYGQSRPSSQLPSNVDRRLVFADRLWKIVKHNQDRTQTYKKGFNQFSDMTSEEFFSFYRLDEQRENAEQQCSATRAEAVDLSHIVKDLPANWDWREHNGVTPVKDQGSCGSCWTFSTVGTLEAHFLIKYQQSRNLSEQQLVDCAGAYDNYGCNGGLPSHAFQYISDNGGIATEAAYPYFAKDRPCTIQQSQKSVGVVGGSVNLTKSEDELAIAIFQHGPVSIAYEVIDDFMDYHSGVYTTKDCKNGPDDVNHAVVAVGFGTENGVDYWLVKNSWSTKWGDNGYFKIQRGVNMCGINNCNSYPQDVTDLTKTEVVLQ